ncbi:ubiquitin carboxyl-terminal hydrolase 28 isoform X3 [Erpetoichthys calabaricus]|uniref:ubiquitin carboxyl-terminal hydrolase 28 isoform X3 n=1 Tax=Erpetoichthys calabaricus TaxID=27687 RepID=UPI00223469D5|nr:ubiquitin carboxyl-terminal hydrolase 28 isoform X3 [Erpetoichthys calabaricus]
MTAELQCENEESAEKTQQFLINQLREITGTQDIRILQKTLKASNWDVSQAISLLTAQEPETEVTAVEPSATEGSAVGRDVEKNSNDVTHNDNDDLQAAIQLSLQESCCAQVEERDLNRALEASVAESKACVKRKRCEAWGDNSLNPTDWIRQNDWPVGMKNVGNTCWFSAVIQSLFHLPQFRKLVLNYSVPQSILENCKNQRVKRNIAFMQELRCLFALMVGTNRKFVDPSAAVELLKDAFRTTEAQQDVSEFTHKLLDWLEDAFQLTADGNNPAGKQENPMVQLFYGTFLAERIHNGKTLSNIERFGQYPLQVNGFDSLHECLEGAMVEGEIEALHSDQTIHSSQERWFSKLPPVLTFELSRFEFNQSLGRPEKIHKKLEFPQVIYMDRYLHKNMELTHTKRKEVKTLKEQMIFLQKRLESYLSYGSGPTKYPLADMLQYVLEFASTQPTNLPPTQNIRIAAPPQNETITLATETPLELTSLAETETLTSQVDNQVTSPACQRIPGFKPFTHCNTTTDAPPYPAPHSVTEEELIFIKSCLQRWRREVEQNIQELKDNIETIKNTLENIYSDDQFCQVPYRLHAILVHEGQASAGHYWAYIFDHEAKRWLKYNDISVTESSWDELERDSFGGMKNASAYCLMYIDDNLPNLIAEETDVETGQVLKGLDSLPAVLRRYVWEDNHWFQQEVEEWNEEQFRKVPQKEHPVSMTAESQETTQSVNTSEDLTVQQTHRSLSEEHAGISKEQTAQAIANTAECYEKNGVEAALTEAFHEEYSRLYLLAQEHATPQNDPRLQHVLVYLFQNNAPKRIIERTLLEQFADRNLSYDERSISIMKEARAKLRLIGPEDMDMDEYRKWHEDYSLFRKVFVYLLTGLEQYQNGKISEAVTYLVYAYQNNTTLLMNGSTRGVEEKLIALYRRRCLKELNENAARLFDCGEETDVAECMRIMNDIVIPCMHLMITNDICKEDLDAIETLRNRWCSYLGQDIDAALQEKLGEFLPRLLDCSAEIIVLKEPPKIRPHSSHDLCSRFAAVMESIHGVTPVTVK